MDNMNVIKVAVRYSDSGSSVVVNPVRSASMTATAVLAGPKGEQGDKGEKGDKGDTGTTDYNELQNLPDLTLKADKTYVDAQDTALQDAIDTKQPTGDYATNSNLTAHTSNTANPHNVTKSQVGLSDVPNLDTTAAVANQHTHANKAVLDATTASFTTADEMKLDGIATGAQVNTVTSVAGKTGSVTLAKGDVGLGNVDDTSDLAKPVSTATQTALNLKANVSDTVNLTGNQTVAGVKTFSSSPIVPTATTNTQAVNKQQMDTADALKVNKDGDTMTGQLNAPSLGVGSGRLFISATAPASPIAGDVWVDLS